MAEKPRSLQIVQVDWVDAAAATAGWEDRDKVAAEVPHLIHSWGAVIVNNDEQITLICDFDTKRDSMNGGTVIPRGMVKKIKRLGTWKA